MRDCGLHLPIFHEAKSRDQKENHDQHQDHSLRHTFTLSLNKSHAKSLEIIDYSSPHFSHEGEAHVQRRGLSVEWLRKGNCVTSETRNEAPTEHCLPAPMLLPTAVKYFRFRTRNQRFGIVACKPIRRPPLQHTVGLVANCFVS